MPEPEAMMPEVYVHPGEARVVKEPTIMRTLLGSCVGITFSIPRLQVGALCHPMLPTFPAKHQASPSPMAGNRYVDFVIRDLARQFDVFGARRAEIQVKLFGGADVLLIGNNTSRPTIGQLNSEVAIKVLEEEGFCVVASSLRGNCGVNIIFNTSTGEVLLKRHS
jgi:chemotaxis protein CheD